MKATRLLAVVALASSAAYADSSSSASDDELDTPRMLASGSPACGNTGYKGDGPGAETRREISEIEERMAERHERHRRPIYKALATSLWTAARTEPETAIVVTGLRTAAASMTRLFGARSSSAVTRASSVTSSTNVRVAVP